MTIREDFQRARTDREKEARRIGILDTAEDLLIKSGNERFAISELASRVGVSKSTVFLYFATKEELLLVMYERAFVRAFTELGDRLEPGMSGRAFCEVFIDCMIENPAMLMLRAQMARTIERNVPLETMVSCKKQILDCGMAVSAKLDEVMELEPGTGFRMLMTLLNLTAGAAQVDSLPYVNENQVPEEIAEFLHMISIRNIVLTGAEMVFTGATGRPFD